MMFEPDGTSVMMDETPCTEEQTAYARRFVEKHCDPDLRLEMLQALNLEPYDRVITVSSYGGRTKVVSSQ